MPVKEREFLVKSGIPDPVTGKKINTVVGVATCLIFDSLQEAIEHNGGGAVGEKFVLDRFNTQIGTDERNKVRGEFAKGPSMTDLKADVMAELMEDADARAAIQAHPGDKRAFIDQLITKRAEAKKASLDSTKRAKIEELRAKRPELFKEDEGEGDDNGEAVPA